MPQLSETNPYERRGLDLGKGQKTLNMVEFTELVTKNKVVNGRSFLDAVNIVNAAEGKPRQAQKVLHKQLVRASALHGYQQKMDIQANQRRAKIDAAIKLKG